MIPDCPILPHPFLPPCRGKARMGIDRRNTAVATPSPALADRRNIHYYCCLALLLLSSLTAASAQASSLGRLFFTPQQRAQLEHSHARNGATEEGKTSVLLVNGIVQNKGGARTVWINGVARRAGKSDERNPETVPLAVPGKAKSVQVKVGQQLLLDHPAPQNPAPPGK